jgi:hypothetical protein
MCFVRTFEHRFTVKTWIDFRSSGKLAPRRRANGVSSTVSPNFFNQVLTT